ncbi:hypothetical protein TNCV_2263941 [Trichonephila clavipes]|nr:hypothetical protein TNCV_2263941 [Trichonephila clavipes]
MAFGGSLPQINLVVQGVTQGGHHNSHIENRHRVLFLRVKAQKSSSWHGSEFCMLALPCKATRMFLVVYHVILNHSQVMRTKPEITIPLRTSSPCRREAFVPQKIYASDPLQVGSSKALGLDSHMTLRRRLRGHDH